ncbi:MAG: hypothetical protein KGL39_19865 [Patescibacteria group bacterium]|nr:hypothetical protein [Patescibacteria group bacterium]
MAIVGVNFPTVLDVAKTRDSAGRLVPYVAQLAQANMNITVTPFIASNQPNGHLSSIEVYSPLPSTVQDNQGVNPTFGKDSQSFDTFCRIEDYFEVAETVAKKFGSPNEYRLTRSLAKIRSMGRKFASLYFYGNISTTPTDINGLAIRYNHTSTANAATASNVISAGGTNANSQTTIWFVGNSPMGLTGIYPERADEGAGGFYHRDHGLVTLPNASDGAGGTSARLEIYRDSFRFEGGLGLVDWKQVIAIRNCDTIDLATTNPQTSLTFFMQRALSFMPFETNVPPEPGVIMPNPAFWWYFNRTIREALGHQLLETQISGAGIREGNLRDPNAFYMHKYTYGGYPAGICDVLLNTEAIVGA